MPRSQVDVELIIASGAHKVSNTRRYLVTSIQFSCYIAKFSLSLLFNLHHYLLFHTFGSLSPCHCRVSIIIDILGCAFLNKFQSNLLFFADTETENVVGNQQLAFANRRPSIKSDRIQPNQYLVPQTPLQTMDESIFREQQQSPPQWPQLTPHQQQVPKQTNSIWPEKLNRKNSQYEDGSKSTSHKKVDTEESEYSEEYADENRVDNEEIVTTTVATRKVRLFCLNFGNCAD